MKNVRYSIVDVSPRNRDRTQIPQNSEGGRPGRCPLYCDKVRHFLSEHKDSFTNYQRFKEIKKILLCKKCLR